MPAVVATRMVSALYLLNGTASNMYGESNEARKSLRRGEAMGDCAAGPRAEVDQLSRGSDILNDVQIDRVRALYAGGLRSLSESGQTRQGRREGVGVKNPVTLF